MKFVISRYEHDASWIPAYTDDWVIYDRSKEILDWKNVIKTENKGSDLYDKLSWIIDNYDNLPEVAVLTKCNLFKYITKQEFDLVKDNKTFTPLLTKNHQTKLPVCFYQQGLYWEINNFWYLESHAAKYKDELVEIFDMKNRVYNAFAPGSNYILPKENILRHPKWFYEKLRSFLDWTVYPGDAQILERNLYYLFSCP